MAKKLGRPTKFTKKVGDRICSEVREGLTLRRICHPANMPHRSQVFRWLSMPSLKSFRDQYELAIIDRTEAWAEEVVEISDDGLNDTYFDDNGNMRTDHDVIQRSKLRVETRLKLMAKLKPKKYGEKIDLTNSDRTLKPVSVFMMRPAQGTKVAQRKPLKASK